MKDESTVYHATGVMCEMLTKQSLVFSANFPGNSNWRQDHFKKEYSNGMMGLAVTFLDEVIKFIFLLYEEDFGAVRETVLYLDDQREPHNIPYLSTFLRNSLGQVPGVDSSEIIFEQIRQAMGPEKFLIKWCESEKAAGHPLKAYAGMTNTLVGHYQKLFEKFPQLRSKLIQEAEINIDLGGGYSTPEVSEATDQAFVSYDIESPQGAREKGLQFKFEDRELSVEQKQNYFSKLESQDFKRFDVFTDDFPAEASSYNITSFGFLNSSVRSQSHSRPELDRKLQDLNTMFFACWRILRLAAHGKKIALLTFGRPHYKYLNKLVVFRFADSKMIEAYVPPDLLSLSLFATKNSAGHYFSRDQIKSFLGGH
ncbi:MAG: hypothetical protein ACK5P7_02515 [Bdellovibrio sp.]